MIWVHHLLYGRVGVRVGVGGCGRVWAWVGGWVCVCVKPCYQRIPLCATHAGGHSMSLGLCPTKLPVAWDERTDHPLVPATLARLEQEFLHTTSLHLMAVGDVQSCQLPWQSCANMSVCAVMCNMSVCAVRCQHVYV